MTDRRHRPDHVGQTECDLEPVAERQFGGFPLTLPDDSLLSPLDDEELAAWE
ncbi:hypothetical protein [Isoptericola dokdonensis]|jgi:hypothetical protein|uniref:Uncharacterized protein n=1 Tax=Isoptericola dokdonensis DS-3 TaxID=1300344 RepID=A0A161IHE4_9MICO|nr:hypothetical protein [Isoptericola dokdonensis]ANC31084.1 hypothetical protein I598_1531 [Isoptericola dokdonensis DS-3]